jgi:hypothetical protein
LAVSSSLSARGSTNIDRSREKTIDLPMDLTEDIQRRMNAPKDEDDEDAISARWDGVSIFARALPPLARWGPC